MVIKVKEKCTKKWRWPCRELTRPIAISRVLKAKECMLIARSHTWVLSLLGTLTLKYFHNWVLSHLSTLTLEYSHTWVLSHLCTLTLEYFHTWVLSHFSSLTFEFSHTSGLSYLSTLTLEMLINYKKYASVLLRKKAKKWQKMTENGTMNDCEWDRWLKHTRKNWKKVKKTLCGKKWQ